MPGIDVRLSLFLGEVGQAKPGPGRRENEGGSPEHELSINPYVHLAAGLLELPCVEPAVSSAVSD